MPDLREIIRWDIEVGLQGAQVWCIRSMKMRGDTVFSNYSGGPVLPSSLCSYGLVIKLEFNLLKVEWHDWAGPGVVRH